MIRMKSLQPEHPPSLIGLWVAKDANFLLMDGEDLSEFVLYRDVSTFLYFAYFLKVWKRRFHVP